MNCLLNLKLLLVFKVSKVYLFSFASRISKQRFNFIARLKRIVTATVYSKCWNSHLDGLEPNYFHFFDKPGFVKQKRFLLKSETFKINNSNLENSL